MKIVHAKTDKFGSKKVYAAGNVFADEAEMVDDFEGGEDMDDAAESFEEQEEYDMGEDGEQDASTIDVDNNIFNHLIAECENCKGIFISAMIGSDQAVESINGVCPLCNKETEQTFIGIIKQYPEE